MANICDTKYKITGTKKAVMDLWHVLEDMSPSSTKNIRLNELADYYGIDWQGRHICCRGEIYHFDLFDDRNTDCDILTIETSTAWAGCHDVFKAIGEVLWNELSISYKEIESGCEVYYKHDEGDFFPEECVVNSCGEPFDDVYAESYDTVDDAINEWCYKMNITRNGRSEDEMLNFINGYEYEDSDTYFYINPLTIVEE